MGITGQGSNSLDHGLLILYKSVTMDRSLVLSSSHLYGILDLGYVPYDQVLERASQLIEGGIRILQLRAKKQTKEEVLGLAQSLAPFCREHECLFIVNDYPDIAKACDADGVHIGQDTPDISAIRSLLGPDKIIGRSTHSLEQALNGYAEGADYIGFGPLFPTATKPGRPAIGLSDISKVRSKVPADFPVFCIGGVNEKTLPDVIASGANRVVIVSWLLTHPDVVATTRDLIDFLDKNANQVPSV